MGVDLGFPIPIGTGGSITGGLRELLPVLAVKRMRPSTTAERLEGIRQRVLLGVVPMAEDSLFRRAFVGVDGPLITALSFCAMLRFMSTAPVVEVTKHLKCASCRNRLGVYRAAFTPDGVILESTRRLPPGVKVKRDDPERNVSSLALFESRYAWRCPCGAMPRRRATTLAEEWSRTDGTEYV